MLGKETALNSTIFFFCLSQIMATSQGLTIHIHMRALLPTEAAIRNGAPELKQNPNFKQWPLLEDITLRHLLNEINNYRATCFPTSEALSTAYFKQKS